MIYFDQGLEGTKTTRHNSWRWDLGKEECNAELHKVTPKCWKAAATLENREILNFNTLKDCSHRLVFQWRIYNIAPRPGRGSKGLLISPIAQPFNASTTLQCRWRNTDRLCWESSINSGKNKRHSHYHFVLFSHYSEAILETPLAGRMWVLQETILASQTLYFGKGDMFWEWPRRIIP